MHKVLLGLAVVGLLGGALAEGRFVLDDSSFDYFASDDGYVSIQFDDGVFTLGFSDNVPSDMGVEVGEIDFLPLDEDESFSQASMRRYLPIEVGVNSLEVIHQDASLEAVMTAYDTQLTDLGFSGSVEQTGANQTVMRYEQGDTVARVVFTRQGEAIKVFMNTL